MSVHRIHLRGPWEYEWLIPPPAGPAGDDEPAFPASGRVRMPASWEELFGDLPGRVRFRRRFHRPTGLDPDQRLFLVFEGVCGSAIVRLNDEELGRIESTDTTARFEATASVRPNSELVVEIAHDPRAIPKRPGGLWGAVALEIASA